MVRNSVDRRLDSAASLSIRALISILRIGIGGAGIGVGGQRIPVVRRLHDHDGVAVAECVGDEITGTGMDRKVLVLARCDRVDWPEVGRISAYVDARYV